MSADKLKYVCIHGHFYQPPRENAYSGIIEDQPSAAPYRNWNERINKECYEANAMAAILKNHEVVEEIINNYGYISFNFGPTLLSWLEQKAPGVYHSILEADRESQDRYNGHGSAIAQAYNHMIMPLANEEDKKTQTFWGIKDFEFRFNRAPEGMWLPETAVDIPTLETLAMMGIKYTILSPNQALKVRKLKASHWHHVEEKTLVTQWPYLCKLPSGKSIVIFFYDGSISSEVAFGELLRDGESFARRLTSGFDEAADEARLIHIATDGETYGHHHPFGNMALAYALKHIQKNQLAQMTIYGEFLAKYPPRHEVVIKENTSWSCSHGVERWSSDCGCALDAKKLWNQKWRKPLRLSLDWLRDRLAGTYVKTLSPYVNDPWDVRNHYINVILNPKGLSFENFMKSFCKKELSDNDLTVLRAALEMQRFAMLMYTSCGWFFDDIAGIEAKQILQYAARAISLQQQLAPSDTEAKFVARLNKAKSNEKEAKYGGDVYEESVNRTSGIR